MIDGGDLPRGLKPANPLPECDEADPQRIRRTRLVDLECDIAKLAAAQGRLERHVSELVRQVGELELITYATAEPPRKTRVIHLKRVFCGDYACSICTVDGLIPPVGGPRPASQRS